MEREQEKRESFAMKGERERERGASSREGRYDIIQTLGATNR